MTERTEMDVGDGLRALTLSANGECLVSGHWEDGVRVWRGRCLVARMEAEKVISLATSQDGKWIAAGTVNGEVFVWNANTHEQAFRLKKDNWAINGVDFSPDSTRLVFASSNSTATIWNVNTCKQEETLGHDGWVVAAKHSTDGGRIATATFHRVRVWDSFDGSLLVDVQVEVVTHYNNGLAWCHDHLFVVSDLQAIKELDASTGSTVSEWPVPDADHHPCIALPKHGRFIACSTDDTVAFWDTFTRSKIAQIQHTQDIRSIVISHDDLAFSIGSEHGKVVLDSPSRVIDPCHLSLQEPVIQIEPTAFNAWQHDHLGRAEAMLDTVIATSSYQDHHALAGRALIRARLARLDDALADAEKSIDTRPSVIGYIAKSIAHLGKGDRHEAYRSCDIAIERFHSDHVTFLLLVKSVVVFMANEHIDAISRVDDLIAIYPFVFTFYVAHMLFLHGNSLMERRNYEGAIQAFKRARAQLRPYLPQSLFLISLIFGWKFDNLDILIRQCMCEALHLAGRATIAGEYLLELVHSLEKEVYMSRAVVDWVSNFTRRCLTASASDTTSSTTRAVEHAKWTADFKHLLSRKLEEYGNAMMLARRHDEAIVLYSRALSLDCKPRKDLLAKRSKACANMGLWKDAIDDANQVILLDPSSPLGYERKYAAARGAGDHGDAQVAFETMLSKMSESQDAEIRERRCRYVRPTETEAAIHKAVQVAIRESPPVLINTFSGHLLDKAGQASSFESRPIFHELVSSTTTHIDHAHIQDEVSHYYHYAMFSHKWKEREPSFDDVSELTVYGLEESPTHKKLQRFCEVAREAGIHWAWSDTCCINKSDPSVLQEALVSMFQWYQSSTLTVVLLCDIPLHSLFDSIWNSRAWTFQEYHASKVVRFYNKDWTLYKNLDTPNHKESPEIIAEMEEATGISAQALMALQPGLEDIREKLRLASTRQSTRVEDEAYSLLGIFSLSMSIEYGEGDRALGRLLAQLLASSGDTSILAWTGELGGFNSCLPAKISVFSQSVTSYIPPAITCADVETASGGLRRGALNLLTNLFDRLNELPVPQFSGKRMMLPCIVLKLGRLLVSWSGSERVFRAQTGALGIVEIRTDEDLSRLRSPVLVHPWIDFLLDRQPVGGVMESPEPQPSLGGVFEAVPEEGTEGQSPWNGEPSSPGPSPITPRSGSRLIPRLFSRRTARLASDARSLCPPSTLSDADKRTEAVRVLARLRQPFGALLLTPDARNVSAYRRVAAGSLITVRVVEEEMTAAMVDRLIRSVDVLDVL